MRTAFSWMWPARLRGLLVALALSPGEAVSRAALIDWNWGEQPPAEATNALQRLVSRLRRALPGVVVEPLVDGYRLRIPPHAVDVVQFERRGVEALSWWSVLRCRDVFAGFADGAWLVELAAVVNGSDVAQATLSGLGLRRRCWAGRRARTRRPADRRDTRPCWRTRLLGECRNLRILATSWEPLGITGEALWSVAPSENEFAVWLLRDWAAEMRADLVVDDQTLARVCRALDGCRS